jgi:hypothetical protein
VADRRARSSRSAVQRAAITGVYVYRQTAVREKDAAQGKPPARRADLQFGVGPDGQIFVLNKRDGVIRLLVADRATSSQ